MPVPGAQMFAKRRFPGLSKNPTVSSLNNSHGGRTWKKAFWVLTGIVMTQGCTAHVAHRPHAPQGNYELAIVCLFLITQFLNVNFVDNIVLKCQRVGRESFPEPSPGTGLQWLV